MNALSYKFVSADSGDNKAQCSKRRLEMVFEFKYANDGSGNVKWVQECNESPQKMKSVILLTIFNLSVISVILPTDAIVNSMKISPAAHGKPKV